jgi:hypothetical protein
MRDTYIYIDDSGIGRIVTNIWIKIAGAWKQNVLSFAKISGIWKQCIDYPVMSLDVSVTQTFDFEGVPLNGTGVINLTSNVDWTSYNSSGGWMSIYPTLGGDGTTSITITVSMNYGSLRTCYVDFRTNGFTYATLHISQAAM